MQKSAYPMIQMDKAFDLVIEQAKLHKITQSIVT